jgi:hypothetical protein
MLALDLVGRGILVVHNRLVTREADSVHDRDIST